MTYNELESEYRQNMFARDNKKESLIEYYQELEDKNMTGDNEKKSLSFGCSILRL